MENGLKMFNITENVLKKYIVTIVYFDSNAIEFLSRKATSEKLLFKLYIM